MYVCVCNAVNERSIEQAVDNGVRSIKGLCLATRAGTCCGKCLPTAKQHLEKALEVREKALKVPVYVPQTTDKVA